LYEAIEHRFSKHLGKLSLHHDEKAKLGGIPDASVDLVYSMDVFVHFKADLVHQFLESITRVLKPGGKALIHFVTWNDRAMEIWREQHRPDMDGKYGIMFYNSMDQLRVSAKSLGLKIEQVGPEIGWAFLARFEKP
jgi:cyclopropane fatty-acyl-phospholipid synthase-like methyltransferase